MFSRSTQRIASATRSARRLQHTLPPWANKPAFPKVDAKAGAEFKKFLDDSAHHAEGTSKLWKKITYFVALPAIALFAIPVVKIELDHAKHREHIKHLSDEEWPTQYPYQNIRSKDFFWGDGDKTLFWNSDINRHIRSD